MGDEPTKRCNRCQTIRPLTEWGRDRSRADGLAPRCKLCNREKALVQRSNPERQAYMRDYQRQWCAARRAEWFADKTCVDCGSVDALEIDHVDPAQKVSSHIWSWAEERRVVELEKCVVRCNPCHARKTTIHRDSGFKPSKLTFEQVGEIRRRRQEGEKSKVLAEEFGISTRYVRQLAAGQWRKIA